MRDPEEALTTAYYLCLEGRIQYNGATIPVFVKGVPSATPAPYISIAEVGLTPDLSFPDTFEGTLLLDVVTEYDNELFRFSEASRIGSLCMELTDKADLNAVINTGIADAQIQPHNIQLTEVRTEPDNLTVKWDVARHYLDSSQSLLEDRETKLVNRRLIRFRDKLYKI